MEGENEDTHTHREYLRIFNMQINKASKDTLNSHL